MLIEQVGNGDNGNNSKIYCVPFEEELYFNQITKEKYRIK